MSHRVLPKSFHEATAVAQKRFGATIGKLDKQKHKRFLNATVIASPNNSFENRKHCAFVPRGRMLGDHLRRCMQSITNAKLCYTFAIVKLSEHVASQKQNHSRPNKTNSTESTHQKQEGDMSRGSLFLQTCSGETCSVMPRQEAFVFAMGLLVCFASGSAWGTVGCSTLTAPSCFTNLSFGSPTNTSRRQGNKADFALIFSGNMTE